MVSSGFGHPIPASVLAMLAPDDRAAVLAKSEPSDLSADLLIRVVKGLPDTVAKNFIDASRHHSPIMLAQDTSAISIPTAQEAALVHIIEDYLPSRSERSHRNDRMQLNKWLRDGLGKKSLRQIDQFDLYEFFEDQGERLSRSSIGVLKAAMSNVFNWAMKQRELGVNVNPLRGLDLTEYGHDGVKKRPFTSDELHRLFNLTMTADDWMALAVLITTGMRGGELMQVHEIKLQNGIRHFDLRCIPAAKTRGSRRLVPVRDSLEFVPPLKTNQARLNAIIRKEWPNCRVPYDCAVI